MYPVQYFQFSQKTGISFLGLEKPFSGYTFGVPNAFVFKLSFFFVFLEGQTIEVGGGANEAGSGTQNEHCKRVKLLC